MTRQLDVYLGDACAGTLTQDGAGAVSFTYATGFLGQADAQAISVSLPLREAPYTDVAARPYFSGLLPDETARRRLAAALGISPGNAFGLLEVIGGDCAGALSLLPAGQTPPPSDDVGLELLTDGRLATILEKLRDRPLLGGEEGVRLSLAGAQDKLAVCLDGDSIALAKGGRPTTHILKPFIRGLDRTVENELFCLRLAARLKLPVAAAEMRRSGDVPYLLVERYDRARKGNAITRLHQEDFCQALGVPPELKYESEGGPGVDRSLNLIARASARPAADRLSFLRMLIFHYLVGNADAHGKNYALLYRSKAPELAPLYDVVCTAAYPRLDKKLAMAIGKRALPDTIHLKHWLTLVADTSTAQRVLTRELVDMAGRVRTEADALMREFENAGMAHEVLTTVRTVIETRARHLARTVEEG